MPLRMPIGSARPPDLTPTVRSWFDALVAADLRKLKSLTHPDFQFTGEGRGVFAPARGWHELAQRVEEIRSRQVPCPTLLGIERQGGGGFLITWEIQPAGREPGEQGLSFAHSESALIRAVSTHSLPPQRYRAPALEPSVQTASTPPPPAADGWDDVHARVRFLQSRLPGNEPAGERGSRWNLLRRGGKHR